MSQAEMISAQSWIHHSHLPSNNFKQLYQIFVAIQHLISIRLFDTDVHILNWISLKYTTLSCKHDWPTNEIEPLGNARAMVLICDSPLSSFKENKIYLNPLYSVCEVFWRLNLVHRSEVQEVCTESRFPHLSEWF